MPMVYSVAQRCDSTECECESQTLRESQRMEPAQQRSDAGQLFVCSTSGTTFADKESYMAHMKSDFHRYNLKRKARHACPPE